MGPVLVRVIAVATFNLNSAAMPIDRVIEARLSRKCVSGRGREGKGAGAARQRSLLHLQLCPNPFPLPLAQQDWRDETKKLAPNQRENVCNRPNAPPQAPRELEQGKASEQGRASKRGRASERGRASKQSKATQQSPIHTRASKEVESHR